MSRRAVSPVTGTVLLLLCTAVLSGAIGAVVLGSDVDATPAPSVAVSATANANTDRVLLLHRTGEPLDVRRLDVRISVNGTALDRQPPVPFFSATGFRSGPTGPFNSADEPTWTPGERASVRLAGTNAPTLSPGDAVTVRLVSDGRTIAVARTTAVS